ncbi:hypothetical protein [Rhodoferax sp.]|uniref:hypothetical protein n=1 Tax=Rhodoferax sp. TaxID=50421 RepID=UPI0026180882|nr:hypothetical protein [Rhodoferax sp.]
MAHRRTPQRSQLTTTRTTTSSQKPQSDVKVIVETQKSRHEDGFFAFADSAPVTNGEPASL